MITIVAHRGASAEAPENTLAAFKQALTLGADAIELDIHETLDGQIVVHHDYLLGHPDNGWGLIKKTNYDQVSQFDAGSWFSKEFVGEKIPLLSQVFREFGNSFGYELELKGTSQQFLTDVLNLVNLNQLIDQVEFTSPHLVLLPKLKQINRRASCGVIFSPYPEWMDPGLGEDIIVDTMRLVPADVAHLPQSIATTSLVTSLHRHDFRVHLADCNTSKQISQALDLGCDQLTTNDVKLAVKIIRGTSD